MGRRRTTPDEYRQRLLRAEQYLAAHLDEAVEPAALAQLASFSLHHFHRIFRAQLGESVMQHVRRLRLERAARRLRSSDLKILELALEAGYESHEAFTRAFQAQLGITPSDYRHRPSSRLRERACAPLEPAVSVKVVDYPELRVALMRRRGDYGEVGELWARLVGWMGARGLPPSARAGLYGLCPDDPEVTEVHHLRFDACVVVAADFVPDDTVTLGIVPAGTYAVGLHRGPYSTLAATYLDVIGRWFPASGYEPSPDPVVEHYLDDPACTPPEELLTEVRVRSA